MKARPACLSLVVALAASAAAQGPSVTFLSVDSGVEGDGPLEIAWTADGLALLVVNRESDNVTFLDPPTASVTDVVEVGEEPFDVELTPSGQYALVPNSLGDDLSVIDVAARAVVATVPLTGSFPYQVAVASSGAYAVVACAAGSVSVVDLATLQETLSFPTIPQWGYDSWGYTNDPYRNVMPSYPRMDLGADDRTLILPGMNVSEVVVHDVLTGAKLGEVQSIFGGAVAAVLDPTLRYGVFAEGALFGALLVIDLQTWQTTWVGPCDLYCFLPPHPESLLMAPNGLEAVVAADTLDFVDLASADELGGLGYVDAATAAVSADGTHLFAVGSGPLVVADAASRLEVARLDDVMGNRIAAHPTLDRVAVLNAVTDERVTWFDYTGVSLVELGSARTGPPDEGDGPAFLAADAAGARLMTANFLSDGVTVFETDTGTRRWIDTGDRPFACGVDAAGTVGAVLHRTGELAVVDPVKGLLRALFPVGPQPVALAVAPAGDEAYVLDTEDDAVTFVTLAGKQSHVAATLSMGREVLQGDRRPWLSTQGILAVPLRDVPNKKLQLALVDVALRSEVKTFTMGDWMNDAVFTADGSFAYVAMTYGDKVRQLVVDGVNSKKGGQAYVPYPQRLEVSADGQFLYVLANYNPAKLHVLETAGMTQVAELDLPNYPAGDLALGGSFLFVQEPGGLRWLHAAGPATAELGVLPLGSRMVDLLPAADGVLYAVEPERDGVEAFHFGGAASYCGPAAVNSTGQSATAAADGWFQAGTPVLLSAQAMPPGEPGYFLTSTTTGFVPFAGGSQGHLCLGGSIGRFLDQVQVADAAGTFSILADTGALPQPGGTVAAQPGETWHFQAWFRDHNPGATSNFTDGVSVTLD